MKILVSSDARQPNEAYLGALLSVGARPEALRLVRPGDPLPAADAIDVGADGRIVGLF